MKGFTHVAVSLLAVAASLNGVSAHAQEVTAPKSDKDATNDGVGEIVVTAQKRGENLQNVPIAITAISSESLQAKGVTDVLSLTQATPNIYAAPFTISSSTLFFFMRGMGVGNPGQITADPSIGVYENGIYNPRPTPMMFDLDDPERVEILRGPQGSLYGRNTTGGAMNVVSRAPTGEFGVRQLASYASRNQYRSITNLDLPAMGPFKVKGTFTVSGDDGFAKNVDSSTVTDTNDFGMVRRIAGRLAVRFEPSSDFTADYSFSLGRERSTGALLQTPSLEGQQPDPGVTYHYIPDQSYRPVSLPFSETNIRDHGLTLEWRPSNALTVRSITGIRHYDSFQFQDTLEAYGLPIQVVFHPKSNVLTEELQAIGSGWGGRLKYAAGLYYYRENASMHIDDTFFFVAHSITDITLHSVSKAMYAQVTVTPPILDDRLDLTFGARQTWDEKTASRNIVEAGTLKTNKFNPAATLAYRWSDAINTYAKVSTGYRAGGFDEAGPVFTNTFKPETLTSYEIGLKTELFDRHLRGNIAAFYNNFNQIQLPITDPSNVTVTLVKNAGRSHIKGIEADVTLAPTRDLSLNVNYAYLDTVINEVRVGNGPNQKDLFVIPYAPKHSLTVSGDATVARFGESSIGLHVDWSYKTGVYGSAGAGPAVPGREIYMAPTQSTVNGRITLSRELFGKSAQLSVFAKNLFDNRFIAWLSANGSQQSGFFNQNFFRNAPRTVGVEISFGL